jgi:AraC-like DNA-binding protein
MDYQLKQTEEQAEAPKKLPYNLREKKIKDAAYRNMIRADLADELYQKIVDLVIVKKKYKDPNFSSKDLAKLLKTNTRYLSAVVNSRFGMNYSCLLNEYRVKDALRIMADKKNADKNIEEISAMVGFANRQSFYAAFYRIVGETPNGYRKKILSAKQQKK